MSLMGDETLLKVAEAFGGEDAIKIIDMLKTVNEVTDDEIASKMGIRLNIVRKILYKLYDHSLVALRRTRDEKTGWFIFHWKLQPDQLEGYISNQKRRVLEKLQTRLEHEKSHDFFHCGTPSCRKVTFEEAMELVFQCPTCGKQLNHSENGQIVEFLEKKIEQLRKEMSE